MAIYTSKYPELGFYVDGVRYKFASGKFNTEDKKVQAVLDRIADAVKQAEEKPKTKAASKAKAASEK